MLVNQSLAASWSRNSWSFRSLVRPRDAVSLRRDHRCRMTPNQSGRFRMLGYGEREQPVVSKRVVNETAVVVNYLNETLR